MEIIRIKDLEIFAKHGVLKEENVLGQKFLVSADIYGDLKKAAENDDISLSTDYAQVCIRINEFLNENTFALIETAAQKTAETILLDFPLAEKVDVEIKKPWAPVGLPLDYVSVKISEKWHTAYIALGSNMGDRMGYINFAVEKIMNDKMCRVDKISDFIETEPVGEVEQDNFLNGAICVKTLYSPQRLLRFLNGIEKEAHRERVIHWGPRTLDLDIIFFDDIILNEANLTIPHIEAENRGFVMLPLSQIAPYYIHPVSGKRVFETAKKFI